MRGSVGFWREIGIGIEIVQFFSIWASQDVCCWKWVFRFDFILRLLLYFVITKIDVDKISLHAISWPRSNWIIERTKFPELCHELMIIPFLLSDPFLLSKGKHIWSIVLRKSFHESIYLLFEWMILLSLSYGSL